ncbi:MAG: RNA polymerase sigma factor RpoE [Succinivibrionaceae bacterium]
MSDNESDLKLIRLVQQGDKQAFNFLVKKYQYKVVSIAYKYVSEPADAQDIAQEAFIKAYKALAEFRGESSFFTWLYRITMNTAMNYISNSSNKKYNTIDIDTPDIDSYAGSEKLHDITSPEGILIKNDVHKLIKKTLNDLPSELRQAIILREIENLSYEDIAKIMNCPVGTIRSRIFRAREIIESKLLSN